MQKQRNPGPAGRRDPLVAPELYLNRELSWLAFNQRVLALAADEGLPLLERCKFLAIFSSNLDEFFMVRVAGHQNALEAGRPVSSPDMIGRTEQLAQIARTTRHLLRDQARLWTDEIAPALAHHGLGMLTLDELPEIERVRLRRRFAEQVMPVLTPLAPPAGQPFPYTPSLSLHLLIDLSDPQTGERRLARVNLTPTTARFLQVDGGFVPVEEMVRARADQLFVGMEARADTLFRVTRDADFSISDEADDLLGAIEEQLRSRRFGDVVRVEVQGDAPPGLVDELTARLGADPSDVYQVGGLMDLTCLWEVVAAASGRLVLEPWRPRDHRRLGAGADVFQAMRTAEVLVHHPFEDFSSSVVQFIEQAVDDPDVIAIKQTIYRTSGESPIIPALIRAARAGKSVVCVVELQARFDEERNIRWARALEQAGVHMVYGQARRKTHAKLALAVRREGTRIRRYVHVGTGNYNPSTARTYTDLGLFTCDPDITREVDRLFSALAERRDPPSSRHLWVAPHELRGRLLWHIGRVAGAQRRGVPGRITIKANSLLDGPIIRALYRASQAGVQVELFVRGICGLRPGVPGVSDNITVTSIVGRFLEHTRIIAMRSGDRDRYWIGSADMMVRNLDNRVEVMVPVRDPDIRNELESILDRYRADTGSAWRLEADGRWSRRRVRGRPVRAQVELMHDAERAGTGLST